MNEDFDIEETEVEPRGCGGKRDQGGLYMTGRLGGSGTPMSSFFVDPFSLEARTMLTPAQVRLLLGDSSLGTKLFQKRDEDGNVIEIIVLDVIGQTYYTPASFLEELRWLGPSRKISVGVGKQIADYQRLGIPFSWHYVFKSVLPDQEHWKVINDNLWRCPSRHEAHETQEERSALEGLLCSGWFYEMEKPTMTPEDVREPISKSIESGYGYTVYPSVGDFDTPNAAVVCILPGNFLRMESVVGDGEPDPEHAELFGDLPNFQFVTE